jgi:hypothetical protein
MGIGEQPPAAPKMAAIGPGHSPTMMHAGGGAVKRAGSTAFSPMPAMAPMRRETHMGPRGTMMPHLGARQMGIPMPKASKPQAVKRSYS